MRRTTSFDLVVLKMAIHGIVVAGIASNSLFAHVQLFLLRRNTQVKSRAKASCLFLESDIQPELTPPLYSGYTFIHHRVD
ncbi:hypothetical protein DAPPUDRAFT_246499 [Daphnia pulex]|uniref:Uncharacterized protein n=1 Tax=Daphnia pulex TaxID=6669 RepID=E9GQN8_DAPPU|nr:hypothetical protein DAPPUDRAFT_246499 [Daphnia pulex]|eukprot:EFX78145.1 hypothetical protein DAPPUDRAFT_246499 [Daphnia pulex]